MFRQILAGDDAELGGQRLYQHGHQVGPHHHPEELVAEGGACLDIGGEVARIYVADGGDEGGAEQGQLEFSGRNGRGHCGLHAVILHGDMRRA